MKDLIKYINYTKEIMKGHVTGKNIPILVTLCVTNRCNLKCSYCYEEYYDRDHKEFSTEELLKLIDELSSMGTKYISVNGGEALLRKDIEVIIDKIREKNMLCHLTTNGTLIKKNIMVLKKLNSISISLDGDKFGNDLNRGSGSYDKIIEGISCLKENNIKFHTHTVLTRHNKNAVDEILALASEYGFKAQFSFLREEHPSDGEIILDDGEIKKNLNKILSYKKKGRPVFSSYTTYKNVLNWPYPYNRQFILDENSKGRNNPVCLVNRYSCHIEANGMVFPCVVLVNKFKALNFLEVGFKKAWEHLNTCSCKACYNVCSNDLKYIFALKPEVIWNALKIVFNRVFSKTTV